MINAQTASSTRRPIAIAWTCGVVPGHSHATQEEAWACIVEHSQPSAYGYGLCPTCGAPGVLRERRPDGNDQCANGHWYPSRDAKGGK